MDAKLDRQVDLAFRRVELDGLDILFQLPQDGRARIAPKTRDLEIGRSVTCNTLTFSSGGRTAWGSGLHKVRVAGSKLSQTVGSV